MHSNVSSNVVKGLCSIRRQGFYEAPVEDDNTLEAKEPPTQEYDADHEEDEDEGGVGEELEDMKDLPLLDTD